MQWLSIKSFLFTWLETPVLVVPLWVVLLVLPWIIKRWPVKRWFTGIFALGLGLYLVTPLPPIQQLARWGLTVWIPPDSGQPADAIVVLGEGRERSSSQAEVAAHLWQADRAPLIFASGVIDANLITQELHRKGIPPNALQKEDCSQTTEENARFSAALLQPQGIRRIILIASPTHLLRSWLTFQSVGFQVIPYFYPVAPPTVMGFGITEVYREYLGLISYGVRGRFFPRSISGVPMQPSQSQATAGSSNL
jgi:uncharacterized SAM-binding protein YcdF (DUF218 family)